MRILLSIFLGIMCLSVSLLKGQTQASITPEVLDTILNLSESDTLAAMAFIDKYADAPLDSMHLELVFLREELIEDFDLKLAEYDSIIQKLLFLLACTSAMSYAAIEDA